MAKSDLEPSWEEDPTMTDYAIQWAHPAKETWMPYATIHDMSESDAVECLRNARTHLLASGVKLRLVKSIQKIYCDGGF